MPAMPPLSCQLRIHGRTRLQLSIVERHVHCIRTPHTTRTSLDERLENDVTKQLQEVSRIYTSMYLLLGADADARS